MVNGGRSGEMIEEVDEVELAVWRIPPMDGTQEMNVKTLEGEIHLAKDLQPTCRFLPFSVEVCFLLVHRTGKGDSDVAHLFSSMPSRCSH